LTWEEVGETVNSSEVACQLVRQSLRLAKVEYACSVGRTQYVLAF
jgi:hypothetical protein